jgi:putrescine transport system permease protein
MRRHWLLPVATLFGFIFLYAPIISLVVFSFNKSKLVTVWGGFSTKWYGELLNDPQILGAAWISLKIAFISATVALILGTMVALAHYYHRPHHILHGLCGSSRTGTTK